tara:strand:+ start:20777 stop:21025 length:249 start_codon:yes stop_codon:yes gene_type:complete
MMLEAFRINVTLLELDWDSHGSSLIVGDYTKIVVNLYRKNWIRSNCCVYANILMEKIASYRHCILALFSARDPGSYFAVHER